MIPKTIDFDTEILSIIARRRPDLVGKPYPEIKATLAKEIAPKADEPPRVGRGGHRKKRLP